jgi:hypothetical protein
MAEYTLNRTVFKKEDYENAIDISLSQASSPPLPLEDTISISEFFDLYDAIFYDIPIDGDTNSHKYIAQTSGDYAGFEQGNDDVQVLLDEITELRQQNLELSQQNLDLNKQIIKLQTLTTSSVI